MNLTELDDKSICDLPNKEFEDILLKLTEEIKTHENILRTLEYKRYSMIQNRKEKLLKERLVRFNEYKSKIKDLLSENEYKKVIPKNHASLGFFDKKLDYLEDLYHKIYKYKQKFCDYDLIFYRLEETESGYAALEFKVNGYENVIVGRPDSFKCIRQMEIFYDIKKFIEESTYFNFLNDYEKESISYELAVNLDKKDILKIVPRLRYIKESFPNSIITEVMANRNNIDNNFLVYIK